MAHEPRGWQPITLGPDTPAPLGAYSPGTRAGRFVFGTSQRQAKEAIGGLYSLGTDGRITQLDDGLILGNGPCFSTADLRDSP